MSHTRDPHDRRADAWGTLPARRKRKKVRTGLSVPVAATCPNHVWTYDFMFDATFGGRRVKVLTVIDEFTREALAVVPARSDDGVRAQGRTGQALRQPREADDDQV